MMKRFNLETKMADSQNMGKRLEKEKADKTFLQKKIKISSDFCYVTKRSLPHVFASRPRFSRSLLTNYIGTNHGCEHANNTIKSSRNWSCKW